MILETRRDWLLRQAKKVGQQRKRSAAEKLYRALLEQAPDTVEAWFGLAELTLDDAERERCYGRILELEPDNEDVQKLMRGEEVESLFVIPPEPEPEEERDESADEEQKEEDPEEKKEEKKHRLFPFIQVHKLSPDEKIVIKKETKKEKKEIPKARDGDFCYRHQGTPTSLRCYDCDNLICIKCAQKTPVGYVCPDCKKELEDKYYTAKLTDYWIALAVAAPISLIIGALVILGSSALGFWALIVMSAVGGFIGNLIGRIVKKAISGRRGRYIPHLVAGMVGLGVSWGFLYMLVSMDIVGMIALGFYIFVAGGAAFYWTK